METSEGRDAPWPGPRETRLTVVVLAATGMLAAFDRAIITLAGQPLRRDLGLSDAHFGVVSGLAFAVPLALLAVPFGRLADRISRKRVLLLGVAAWSV